MEIEKEFISDLDYVLKVLYIKDKQGSVPSFKEIYPLKNKEQLIELKLKLLEDGFIKEIGGKGLVSGMITDQGKIFISKEGGYKAIDEKAREKEESDHLDCIAKKGYKIIKRIGSGGQSFTFLVEKNKDQLVLKIPNRKRLSKTDLIRFSREIEALKLMNAKNVPEVFEYGIDENVFIIMEYIKGKTLDNYVNGKPINSDVAFSILKSLLDTIQHAHELGLYHRDIKPQNIIINEHEEITLLDFGICWIENDEEDGVTKTGVELGNRFLRLPELSRGKKVTNSVSDITFAIGILFYLTTASYPNQLLDEKGRAPYERDELLGNLNTDKNWKLLNYMFEKGFAYNIARRFQTIEEVIMMIENFNEPESDTTESIDNTRKILKDFLKTDYINKTDQSREIIIKAHKKFLESFKGELIDELVYGGSGPDIKDDGLAIYTHMYLVRKVNQEIKILFYVRTKFDNNFDYTETEYCVHSKIGTSLKKTLSHNINEVSRIMDEFSIAGRECSNEAMKSLKILLEKPINE